MGDSLKTASMNRFESTTKEDSGLREKFGEPEEIKFGQWEGHETFDVLRKNPDYILWVEDNFDDPSDYIRPEVQQMKDMADKARDILENKPESNHVGQQGEFDVFEVHVKKSISYEKKDRRRRVVVMRDKDNNRMTTFLPRSKNVAYDLNRAAPKNQDQNIRIEAKVVNHKEYEGEKDTVLNDIEVLSSGIGELSRESPPKGESFREQRKNRIVNDFKTSWQSAMMSRIRRFSKARRVLKDKPFMDAKIKRLDEAFNTLIKAHESRKQRAQELESDGYGTV